MSTMTSFCQCLREAARNKALIAEYDRLNGTNLSMQGSHLDLAIDGASGRQSKEIEGFVGFVYDCIYLRLPGREIEELKTRLKELTPTTDQVQREIYIKNQQIARQGNTIEAKTGQIAELRATIGRKDRQITDLKQMIATLLFPSDQAADNHDEDDHK